VFGQVAHRWRLGCQPYTSAELFPQKTSGTYLCYRLSNSGAMGSESALPRIDFRIIQFQKLFWCRIIDLLATAV
jgi:hypothetical protein